MPHMQVLDEDIVTTDGKILSKMAIKQQINKLIDASLADTPDEIIMTIMEEARAGTGNPSPSLDVMKERSSLAETMKGGAGTGATVMSAYFDLIVSNYGEENLYRVATHPLSLVVLSRMTRAWHLGELRGKMGRLGAYPDTFGGTGEAPASRLIEYVDISADDHISINDAGKELLESSDPSSRAVCPAGHRVGLPDHDQETIVAFPITQMAERLAAKYERERQKS